MFRLVIVNPAQTLALVSNGGLCLWRKNRRFMCAARPGVQSEKEPKSTRGPALQALDGLYLTWSWCRTAL